MCGVVFLCGVKVELNLKITSNILIFYFFIV